MSIEVLGVRHRSGVRAAPVRVAVERRDIDGEQRIVLHIRAGRQVDHVVLGDLVEAGRLARALTDAAADAPMGRYGGEPDTTVRYR